MRDNTYAYTTLTRERFRIEHATSAHILKDIGQTEVDLHWDIVGANLVAVLTAFIYREDIPHEFFYPANWLEAVKDRWAPNWVLRRWPTKMTIVRTTTRVLYPSFRGRLPKEQYVTMEDRYFV